jgi:hypothetical protein
MPVLAAVLLQGPQYRPETNKAAQYRLLEINKAALA